MLKRSNLITVACCLLPVASFHKSVFNLVQDLSYTKSGYNRAVLSKPRKHSPRRCMQRFYRLGYSGDIDTGFGVSLG
ncbi:MAG: hypothetical protein F6K31_09710 [Symploca sp. SIO2G7]|nr:hypothetical protein [Symploca sp. SIO2G7]